MYGRCLAVATTLAVSVAAGEAPAAELGTRALVEHQDLPRVRLDLGYAVSYRNDSQAAESLDVSAKGLAPSHLRFDGAVWFGDLPLGLAARADWERYSLQGSDLLGGEVSLGVDELVAGGGLAGRVDLKGWALEGTLGYLYQGLPVVHSAADDSFGKGKVTAHGPMLAVRFGLPQGSWLLPDVHVSALPYAMGKTPTGSNTGWALDAGVGLGFGALKLGGLQWSAVLGYDFSTTQLDGDGGQYIRRAHRASLGLRLTVPGGVRMVEPPRLTGPGRILGRLLDPDGNPLARHAVQVAGRPEPLLTGEDGAFEVRKAGPGPVALRAVEPGLKDAAQTVDVPAEQDVRVDLKLARPTGPGTLRGVVYDKPTDPKKRVVVPRARVQVAGLPPVEADERGAFAVANVGPGLVKLTATAEGYLPDDEVVSVPPEAEAKVELALASAKARPLATLRGLVRGPGGKPLAARLTIKETKAQVQAGANGEFKVQLPGGEYNVRIEAPGFIPQTKTVQVADGDQAIFNIDMHAR